MAMNKLCQNIAELFSSQLKKLSEKENCEEYEVVYETTSLNSLPQRIDLSELNSRDSIQISYYVTDDDSLSYLSTSNNWDEFVKDISNLTTTNGKIKILVCKQQYENVLSVYNYALFAQYFAGLSLSQFLSVINNNFNERLVFEIQDDKFSSWKTKTIAFIPKGDAIVVEGVGNVNRLKRIEEARELCFCEMDKYNLLPEDFYCSESHAADLLYEYFQKVCILFTCSFVFDYSILKKDYYEFKLFGYKSLNKVVDSLKVSNVIIDTDSRKSYFDIYQWLYLGGNNIDKINIARNIISLNINQDSFALDSSVKDSILSNYKIYEKENVKQYIEVRNKLSEMLIDLQGKINDIMDSFVSDFKKTLITLVSFFISVIVIRVISKGDFIGGFTNSIIGLSFAFLMIDLGILLYSKWELKEKLSSFRKHYSQIKNRYKELLSDVDLDNIFEECDPERTDKGQSLVEKQTKRYSILWIASIIILSIFLIIVLFINNDWHLFQTHCMLNYNVLIKLLLCFILSIFL
jgi:hypothetical protein